MSSGGGLIQLVTSGLQDSALTYKPEITFFKKAYKRHTNFSTEIKEIYSDQEPYYGEKISFSITNGDLVYRCFIQVTIPALTFTDQSINNVNYINWKNNYISRLNNDSTNWNNLFTNLSNYVNIELILYQELLILFLSDNILLNTLKETVLRFNNIYKTAKYIYINMIDATLYNKINMSGYILSINSLLSYDLVPINSNYISIYTIKSTLNTMYNTMNEYLNYYHSNWKQVQKNYDNITSNNINFAWTQYLGHYYFSQYELDIGGQIVEQYSSDQLHIYQYHHLNEEQINNYNVMIGHDVNLYDFNNSSKPSKVLLIPLVFFFNKASQASLPLVAMRNTSVSVVLTLNSLKNLIYFRDWENEYNNLLILVQPFNGLNNPNLNYNKYEYNIKTKQITYYLINLNAYALQLIYPLFTMDDINTILTDFGTNGVMLLNNWIIFRNNANQYPTILNKMGGYDQYINYNYMLNLVPRPTVKLLVEYVFLDDVERQKFASSKLEYIVEGFQENSFPVGNYQIFDGQIAIDRPNKYFKWFIQPLTYLNGLSEYGKVTPYLYDYSKYFINPIFDQQSLTLNQIEIINQQIDNTYYNYVQGYKTLNRTLPDQVYFYSFSLYPELLQPSGAANLTAIREKKFRYYMNSKFLVEYFEGKLNPNQIGLQFKIMSASYNLFVVQNGIARLIFTIS